MNVVSIFKAPSKEGYLLKKGSKWPYKYYKRYFVLNGNILTYSKSSKNTEHTKGRIILKEKNCSCKYSKNEIEFFIFQNLESKKNKTLSSDKKKNNSKSSTNQNDTDKPTLEKSTENKPFESLIDSDEDNSIIDSSSNGALTPRSYRKRSSSSTSTAKERVSTVDSELRRIWVLKAQNISVRDSWVSEIQRAIVYGEFNINNESSNQEKPVVQIKKKKRAFNPRMSLPQNIHRRFSKMFSHGNGSTSAPTTPPQDQPKKPKKNNFVNRISRIFTTQKSSKEKTKKLFAKQAPEESIDDLRKQIEEYERTNSKHKRQVSEDRARDKDELSQFTENQSSLGSAVTGKGSSHNSKLKVKSHEHGANETDIYDISEVDFTFTMNERGKRNNKGYKDTHDDGEDNTIDLVSDLSDDMFDLPISNYPKNSGESNRGKGIEEECEAAHEDNKNEKREQKKPIITPLNLLSMNKNLDTSLEKAKIKNSLLNHTNSDIEYTNFQPGVLSTNNRASVALGALRKLNRKEGEDVFAFD